MLRDDIMAYLIRIDFQSDERLRRARDLYYMRPDLFTAEEAVRAEYYERIIHKIVQDISALLQSPY